MHTWRGLAPLTKHVHRPYIPVPVGTLTTELVGYESPKNWTIGPPNYAQDIRIWRRVITPVIVEPPSQIIYPVYAAQRVGLW